ncbi:glycerol-3-phosphate 1-O-acyltransferase PlsY [Amphibacillus jilinensis]|uniref:glycerol-3-phosphate 1-O-acyltransferase PlsY n=1 Tax=Amphibacillus jilinensis TaxID=1216008 RepID=UPI00030C83D4|nr:glycerol-3-phosphate 1-O-acyltransferase PlsY [Amphibacillus jilinensis]
MWTYLLFILIAYLLGSFPSGLIVGKVFFQKDIREHGSGNLGATNAFRVLGKKAGIVVTFADILKGTLAASLPFLFNQPELSALVIGIFAVIGHMYPVFANFRGGKAVATSGGMILGVNPLLFLIILITFLIVLYISKYVSLSSMLTSIIAVITSFLLKDYGSLILTSILALFIIYRHIPNIKRIVNRSEPKVPWI